MKKLFKIFAVALVGVSVIGFTACNNGGISGGTITLSTSSLTFGDGQTTAQTVTVMGIDWTAYVTEGSGWITVSPTSGSNGGSFSVETTANEGAARQGQITISDVAGIAAPKILTVTQLAFGSNDILVTSITLDKDVLSVMTEGTATIAATVLPSNATNQTLTWTSSDNTKATVDNNGVVTGISDGPVTITVAATDAGGVTATASVTVNWFGEISFKTDNEWTIGSQIWSDAIVAERCKKDDFYGGTFRDPVFVVDCAQNQGYGDMFSWLAVDTHKEILCPDGWQVPTQQDFIDLDIAMGGPGENNADPGCYVPYIEQWGGEYAGYFWFYQNTLYKDYTGNYACYWAQGEASATQGYGLQFGLGGMMTPAVSVKAMPDKYNGFNVRCVKNS